MISVLALDVEIDRAIRFLTECLPMSDASSRKPILPHNVRVGNFLRERALTRGYSQETVLAGFLHDVLEWSSANEDALREAFGEEIVRLVRASTKNDSIENKEERRRELIARCAGEGLEALVVKTADILDSFRFYTEAENNGELLGHCVPYADEILRVKPAEWNDPIFDELREWKEKVEQKNEVKDK